MSDGGKGSKQRPTDKEKFDRNWDNIFGRKKKTEEEKFDDKVIMQHEFYDIVEEESKRV